MNLPRCIVISVLLLMDFTAIAQKTDVVYLSASNVIIGEIKKLQYGSLSFDTDDAG